MQSKTSLAIIFALVAMISQSQAFRYIPCKLNEIGVAPNSAHIDICQGATDDHCTIERGSNITYNMAFDTIRPFEKAILRISKVDMTNSYQVYDEIDACIDTGLKCPSDLDDKQVLTKKTLFAKDFPKGLHVCRFELIDTQGESLMCQQFLANVV